ncbi:AarF/UbiB family protein [Methylomicrobium sp. Wu6]|uniref:ABC1 kinase family protein n=1 Tax=Methylomicrobium sp. Wu6 TaxID=3107928 RepID=UPI002DD6820B|nr:AarF/UbiB family protein [Methylomicrobium sp. Wu6]MEC4750073.1 AarF/UbiB family protein [Methylomicrobium sp. Wu6]
MLWELINAAKDLSRAQDVATVLIRYGFGGLVHALGVGRALERLGKTLHWQRVEEYAVLDTPHRVRRVLEDLGPTFIKMGQILATRMDLFPPPYIAEFEKLLDEVPSLPFDELIPQLQEDIGGDIDEIFLAIDREPLAAASLAQVHRAILKDGTPVILKIRRPGIRRIIEADLRLLNRVVEVIETDVPELRRYHPREIFRQFSQSLRGELDFAAEGRHAERVAGNLAANQDIKIAAIHWELTGERLNVQEYIEGIPGRDLAALDRAGLDRKLLAERGAKAVLKMIMEDGFFHADPHPGNVFYLPDNRLAFIDFGMMGRLTEERRGQVITFLYGMVNRMPMKVVEILEDWSGVIKTDEQALAIEIDAFVDQYSSRSLKDLSLQMMLGDLLAILRDHNLTLPPDLALLIKAYVTLDGFGRHLDPDFNTLVFAAPYLQQLMADRYRPDVMAKRGWRNLIGIVDLLSAFPKELHQLLRASRKGAIQVDINVKGIGQYVDKIDVAISRLTMGIVTAALIIGTSIIMTVKGENAILSLPVLGFFGYIFAFLGGLWLLFSIWRSNKGS